MLALEFAARGPIVSHRPGAARGKSLRASTRGRRLASLSSTGLGDAFYSWRGASGLRYVFSVFSAQDAEVIAAFSGAAIIGVARDGMTRRAVCISTSREFARIAAASADAGGAIAEWHVLFAADEAALEDICGALSR